MRTKEIILLFLILLANALFLRWNAFRSFNFYDMGGYMTAAWRIYKGQLPFVDFIYQCGPLHLYVMAAGYVLFGFGKTAMLAHLVLASSLAVATLFLTARKYLSFVLTVVVTLFSAVTFYWPISHPWFDQTAHLWCWPVLLLLFSRVPFKEKSEAFRWGMLSGIAAVLSLMTKTNIGGAYGVMFFAVFLMLPKRIHSLAGYLAGVLAAAAVMILLVRSPKDFWFQAFVLYSGSQRSRLVFDIPLDWWITGKIFWYYPPFLMAVLGCVLKYRAINKARLVLFFGVFAVSLFSTCTGSMRWEGNTALLGMYVTFALIIIRDALKSASPLIRRTILFLLGIYVLGLTAVIARISTDLRVWAYSGRNPVGAYALETKPLDGWRCHVEMGQLVDRMTNAITQTVPPDDSLLVLSGLQILYPLTGHEAFRDVHFNMTTYDLNFGSVPYELTRKAIVDHPPDWIVAQWLVVPGGIDIAATNDIVTRLDLFDWIRERYGEVYRFGPLMLLKRMS